MAEGQVKFYNISKRFGFIAGDDGKDYFVHQTGVVPGTQLNEGDRVSFDIIQGDKGPKAENVKKL
jgi:CspA family cold shock protein